MNHEYMLWLEYVGVLAIPADFSARSNLIIQIQFFKPPSLYTFAFTPVFFSGCLPFFAKDQSWTCRGSRPKRGSSITLEGLGEAAARLAEESPQVVFQWPRGLGQEVPIGTPFFKKQGKSGKYNYITNMHDIFF